MRGGMWFAITRFALLRFESSQQHLRNWRPVVLVLAGNPHARQRMIQFADWIEAGSGFLFLAQIVTGELDPLLPKQPRLQDNLRTFIQEKGLSAAARTVVAKDFESGVLTLLQVTGLGEFEPNTVLIGWSEDAIKRDGFLGSLRRILGLKRNLLVYAEADDEDDTTLDRCIDVWWYDKTNASFMLTLAYLIQSNRKWENHKIRVRKIIRDEDGIDAAREGLIQQLAEYRIPAEADVIASTDPPLEVIARLSERSAVTFVGLREPDPDDPNPLEGYEILIQRLLGDVLLCKSWHVLKD